MTELAFSNLSLKVGQRALLEGVTLRVERGDFVALLGPNGAGKTTLLKLALGLRAPTSGNVSLSGREVAQLSARERAALVAWLPQHVRADEPVSALDAVAAARFRFAETHAASLHAARAALARVRAEQYANRRVTELSGGERQRVALACLLAQEANLLLFDEPANHLDPAQQLEVYRLLGELWRQGHTIVCVNHDVNLLNHVGNPAHVRLLGLTHGRLELEATFVEPDLPARLGALFAVHLCALEDQGRRFIVPASGSPT